MWASVSEQTSDNTLQNEEEKANLLQHVQILLPRQTAGMKGTQCVAGKSCTPTTLNTELPMVSVGEGSQPCLEDEDPVATSPTRGI